MHDLGYHVLFATALKSETKDKNSALTSVLMF